MIEKAWVQGSEASGVAHSLACSVRMFISLDPCSRRIALAYAPHWSFFARALGVGSLWPVCGDHFDQSSEQSCDISTHSFSQGQAVQVPLGA